MSESPEGRKAKLRELIAELHAGAAPDQVREEFREVLKGTTPTAIAKLEQELIEEGMPKEEVRRLCDVHLAVFKESLEQGISYPPPGHPVHILMEEHRILLGFAYETGQAARKTKGTADFHSASDDVTRLDRLLAHFKESETHYVREENVLFPYLERHGVTHPPAIMWSEHNEIREKEKRLYELMDRSNGMDFHDFTNQLAHASASLSDMLQSHFYKENNILFPTALEVIAESEWPEIKKEFDELGYCPFTPEYTEEAAVREKAGAPEAVPDGQIVLETGSFSREELETLLNSLPVDITFVDKEDRVRYFSDAKERIFPRTKAIIGRTVQQCHPEKSLQTVNKIVDDFRNGRRDVAEFWINLNDRLIYIRYFPVRRDGKYLGTLEVTQDITGVKKIEGEKRLL